MMMVQVMIKSDAGGADAVAHLVLYQRRAVLLPASSTGGTPAG